MKTLGYRNGKGYIHIQKAAKAAIQFLKTGQLGLCKVSKTKVEEDHDLFPQMTVHFVLHWFSFSLSVLHSEVRNQDELNKNMPETIIWLISSVQISIVPREENLFEARQHKKHK